MNIYIVDDNFVIEKKVRKIVEHLDLSNAQFDLEPIVIDYPEKFYDELPFMEIADNSIFILDIDLNTHFTGIDLGKTIRAVNSECYVVYLTNFHDKAISVINENIHPWSYIVKELDDTRFETAIADALTTIFHQQMTREQSSDFLTFSVQKREILVPAKEVMYLKSMNGYKHSVLVCTMEEELIVDGTLKKFKTTLKQPFFFKELRAYVLNMNALTEWSRDEQYVGFINGEVLELGVKSIDKLKKALVQAGYR